MLSGGIRTKRCPAKAVSKLLKFQREPHEQSPVMLFTDVCLFRITGGNPFVETTLNYVLSYIHSHAAKPITPCRLVILADNDYYSQSGISEGGNGRFVKFGVTLKEANKTGLGSSAALVTSLTATLLKHYLAFDVTTTQGRKTLHNLAQAAHCAAQGKVGSGFDVAAAVYGSCTYRRFSPAVLSSIPEAGAAGFAEKLLSVIDKEPWDVEVESENLALPQNVALLMCDVDCGSQTVGMVKQVLAWRSADAQQSLALWDDLQRKNEVLGQVLQNSELDSLPEKVGEVRELIRKMGQLSDVPIEPDSQTELLDAVSKVEGVYGGVVPGAGGFDALALLVKDDAATKKGLEEFLAKWSSEKGSKVKLLNVKGEMDGAKQEDLSIYDGWFA